MEIPHSKPMGFSLRALGFHRHFLPGRGGQVGWGWHCLPGALVGESGILTVRHGKWPIEIDGLPIKNGGLPIKNGDYPLVN